MAVPLKILIVEDMLTIRLLLGGLIRAALRPERPILLEAQDGQAGLDTALREQPDLVISDISMPKMDGLTLCKRLKEAPTLARTSVVLITTNAVHRQEGQEVGAAAFLTKPIREAELELALKTALSTRR